MGILASTIGFSGSGLGAGGCGSSSDPQEMSNDAIINSNGNGNL
jgi:hypothetical protein